MIECTNPEGHLFNKWAIEGGAVCSHCGAKLSLSQTLAMLCEHPALKGALIKANRFNELSSIESSPAWDKDSPFQKEIDALIAQEQE